MKTAFMFSGQGAQYNGMCKEFYDNFKEVKNVFETANSRLSYSLEQICFEEDERLNQTEFTQPAVLNMDIAVLTAFQKALKDENIDLEADYSLGLSLGEYAALVHSGAFEFADSIELISKRGKFMAECSSLGGMSAIMNLDRNLVEEACKEAESLGVISPANYNTPAQIVISGELKALEKAGELALEKGAKRVVPLKVSGPFHSKLLEPASKKLNDELVKMSLGEMNIPVVSNVTASTIGQTADIVNLLNLQIMSPVKWEDSIKYLVDQGVTRFIELGPAKTLCSFVKKINKDVETYNIEDMKSLEKTMTALKENK